jgi:hypothetical protein
MTTWTGFVWSRVGTSGSLLWTRLQDIELCSLGEVDRRFRGAYCLGHQGDLMERVCTSEKSVYFNENTRRCIPESCHLHTRHCENLKYYTVTKLLVSRNSVISWLVSPLLASQGPLCTKLVNNNNLGLVPSWHEPLFARTLVEKFKRRLASSSKLRRTS